MNNKLLLYTGTIVIFLLPIFVMGMDSEATLNQTITLHFNIDQFGQNNLQQNFIKKICPQLQNIPPTDFIHHAIITTQQEPNNNNSLENDGNLYLDISCQCKFSTANTDHRIYLPEFWIKNADITEITCGSYHKDSQNFDNPNNLVTLQFSLKDKFKILRFITMIIEKRNKKTIQFYQNQHTQEIARLQLNNNSIQNNSTENATIEQYKQERDSAIRSRNLWITGIFFTALSYCIKHIFFK